MYIVPVDTHTSADESKDGALSRPLAKGSVVKTVIDRIREAIVNRELNPGDYLPSETELVSRLGVGKTSVREAIKSLEAMGVVEVRQGHGTIIRKDPGADIISPLVFQLLLQKGTNDELLDFRRVFEPTASVFAMHNATEDDRERLKETVRNHEKKVKAGTNSAEDDLEFHRIIFESTHNSYIVLLGNTILKLFEPSMQESARTIPETTLKDHKKILTAFNSGDDAKLLAAVLESYEGWKKSLNQLMKRYQQ